MGRRLLLCGLHLLVLMALVASPVGIPGNTLAQTAERGSLPPAGDWDTSPAAVQDRTPGPTGGHRPLPPTDDWTAPPALDSDWVLERVDAPRSFERSGNRSLALDVSGYPHMAYGAEQLYYAWYDGAAWQIETVDPTWNAGRYTSLALDSLGRPHISYYAAGSGLRYAYQDGSAWQISTVDPTGGIYTSLALDPAGRPGISYYTGVLQYAHFDGTAWQTETVDSASSVGRYSALAMEAGLPRIAYYDAGNGDLKYAAFDGAVWQTETVTTTWYSGKYASLALDSAGRPHITYCRSADPNYCDYLDYAHYDGTAWQIEHVGSEAGWYTSLVLDAADHPHVTFLDWWDYYLKYAYYDGSSWHVQTVDGWAQGSWYTSLALDAAGHPHVGYYQGYVNTAAQSLKHAYNAGAGWQIEIVDPGGDAGQYNSLVLDSAGRPHISYMGGPPYYDLRYASYDGTAWVTETVDSAGYVGEWTSLALDAADRPHISYYDQSHNALKYARYDGTAWVSTTVDVNLGTYGGSTSLELDMADRPHIAYVDGYSYLLKYARYDGAAWITETVAAGGMYRISSPSLALDATGRPHISYYTNGLHYVYYDGTAWQLQTVDSGGYGSSLTLDTADRPHIGYYRYDSTRDEYILRHAYYDGTAWILSTVDGIGVDMGSTIPGNISLVLDTAGRPHITYSGEVSYRSQLRYARYDGFTWQVAVVDSDLGYEFQDSLVLDAEELPHISYYDWNWGDLKYASVTTCVPLTAVSVAGPTSLPAWVPAVYTATATPITATLPGLSWDNGSTGSTAVYSWTVPGAHTLAVTGTNFCSLVGATYTVTVQGPCEPIEAAGFSWVPLYPAAGQEVTLTAMAVGSPRWSLTTVDSTGNVGKYTSLAVDVAGRPHISYYDASGLNLRHAWYDGTSWNVTTVDSPGNVGRFSSLALDADGQPHIAYLDVTNAALKYARYSAASWYIETVATGVGSNVYSQMISLALDPAGHPRISYLGGGNPPHLQYAQFDGLYWTIETVDGGSGVGESNALALDTRGFPQIAYTGPSGDGLRYTRFDGATWYSETVSDDADAAVSLQLDDDGLPHIAFHRTSGLFYAHYENGSWQISVVANPGGQYNSLALDAAGRPRVSFYDEAGEDLEYASYDGTAWHSETVEGSRPVGKYNSIDVDAAYRPHISYYESVSYPGPEDAAFGPAATWKEESHVGPSVGQRISKDIAGYLDTATGEDLRYARLEGVPTPPISYHWDLGDGTRTEGEVVNHIYAAGTYTVVLTATNCLGYGLEVDTHVLTVAPACEAAHDADFAWTPLTPTAGLPLTLTAWASGTLPITYSWDFGDGSTGSGITATHVYTLPGTYTVALTAANCGPEPAIAVHTITVVPYCDPVQDADFAWTPLTPTAGLPLTLTATASGTLPITYTWDFGDGGTGSGMTVTHVYPVPGPYTVTLTAANCGPEPAIAVHTLTVVPACEAAHGADFAWTPLTPTAGLPLTLTAWATGTLPITFTWDFGDGGTGSGVTVTHVYPVPGPYTVALTAANCGPEPATAVHTLTVAAPPCAAVEILTVTTVLSECTVAFGAELTGALPFAYLWTWASGTYTETNPVVAFGVTGTYTGTLEVWNCGGAGHDVRALTVAVECAPPEWMIYLPLILRGGNK